MYTLYETPYRRLWRALFENAFQLLRCFKPVAAVATHRRSLVPSLAYSGFTNNDDDDDDDESDE